jgi:hypothetical protein
MLLHEENVVMTDETQTDLSQIATASSTNNLRHDDAHGWARKPKPTPETDKELVCSTPPVSWPRVFPGL